MKLLTMVIIICLTQLSACSNKSAPKENEVASVNKENKICTEEKVTGSRVSRTVCRTPAQIEEDKKRARELADNRQN